MVTLMIEFFRITTTKNVFRVTVPVPLFSESYAEILSKLEIESKEPCLRCEYDDGGYCDCACCDACGCCDDG